MFHPESKASREKPVASYPLDRRCTLRYRAKSSPMAHPYAERLVGGPFSGYTAEGFYGGLSPGPSSEEIWDLVDPRLRAGSRPGRFGVGPMTSRKASVKGTSFSPRSNYPWVGETVHLLGSRELRLNTIPGIETYWSLLRTLDPESSAMSSLATEARLAFTDQMPEEVKLPNFVFELREVADLVPSMLEFAKGFSAQKAAGSYLSYEFGMAPFIGDLMKLSSLLTSVDKRIKFLQQTSGKEVRLTYGKKNVVDLPALRPWHRLSTGGIEWVVPGFGYEAYELTAQTDVRFTARLTQRLEGLDTLGAKVRALLAATGFNDPLGMLWEAVPFSFVVDWVANVGDLFAGTKAQPFQGLWHVYDVCWSVRSKSVFQLRQRDLQGGWLLSDDVGRLTLSYVRRGIGFPERVLSLDWSQMTPKQLILASALLFGVYGR